MNVLLLMAAILLILMIWIGGDKGVKSFISLFFNFGVLMVTIFFMLNPNNNPMILTMIACTVIGCVNLFYINQVNRKTTTAFFSTLITMVFLILFIDIVTKVTMIQGFGPEQYDEGLAPFSLFIGTNFVKIEVSVIMISTIGAITDVAISITTSMSEILNHNPSISKKGLFLSGLRIGKDILGTDTNTLFFAFFGSYMALLLWFKDLSYTVGNIANSKLFCAEMITIFCAGIGIALIIPITAWINAYFPVKREEKSG